MHIDCIKIIFMQSIFLWYNTIYNINGFIVVCKSTTVYCLKIRNTLGSVLSFLPECNPRKGSFLIIVGTDCDSESKIVY